MKNIISIILFVISALLSAQSEKKFPLKNYFVTHLPDSLEETSGLDFFNGELFSFNDSGNSSELFKISPKTGKILKVYHPDIVNKDCEAITNDGQHIYMADFGNNLGTRQDLTIYKIKMEGDSLQSPIVKLPFYYPEQEDFSRNNRNTDFDAESIIYHKGKLHIFTKEWKSKNTTHYTIDPNNTEKQAAEKLESFPIGFVATDAAYYNGRLYIVGYTKSLRAFLYIFEENSDGLFFQGKNEKYTLGGVLTVGQIEGIAVDDSGIYLSGEKFKVPVKLIKQSLYFIPATDL